jgi:CDP-diacylglycerol--glycerol-3-phosphate 3-phosphatidyltransferase
MTIPNKLTVSRLILSPLFFLCFFLPVWLDGITQTDWLSLPLVIVLSVLFLCIEISDLVDGIIARSRNLVTDIGKLLDPFADVMSRMTYFICFTIYGIMPAWIFIVLFYRELGIIFIRLLLFREGIALAARKGGKIKATFYAMSGGAGIIAFSLQRLGAQERVQEVWHYLTISVFLIALLLSVVSFLEYFLMFRKEYMRIHKKKAD